MRSQSSITARSLQLVVLAAMILPSHTVMSAQRLAIIAPDNAVRDNAFADDIAARFPRPIKVLDRDQSAAAFRSVTLVDPFNQNTGDARVVAAVVGCDYFLLIRTLVLRRSPLSRPPYFEASLILYVIDGRSGEMVAWLLKTFEAETDRKAETELFLSAAPIVAEVAGRLRRSPVINVASANIESVPDEGSPEAAELKTPIPYKRIKPEYTTTAFLYDVKATVDIEVDIESDGSISRTRIERWAGYGLDESVESAVRAMNWRPAIRKGKPLAMRVLLRYNFTKVEKE